MADAVINDCAARIATLTDKIKAQRAQLSTHCALSPTKQKQRAGWQERTDELSAGVKRLEEERDRETSIRAALLGERASVGRHAGDDQRAGAKVFVHKPSPPRVFDPAALDFSTWCTMVKNYFRQVSVGCVGAALIEFLKPEHAVELQVLIDTNPMLSLEECLAALRPICVTHTRAETLRRGLFKCCARTAPAFVRAFWSAFDCIPAHERPPFLWIHTAFLMRADDCGYGDLAKEVRKDLFKECDAGSTPNVSLADFRSMTHLAVGMEVSDVLRGVSNMDVDALEEQKDDMIAAVNKLSTQVKRVLSRPAVRFGGESDKPDTTTCYQYENGRCTYGPNCRYHHAKRDGICVTCGSSAHAASACPQMGGERRPARGRGY